MKKYYLLLILLLTSISLPAQDYVRGYIHHANRYARVNIKQYRRHMCRNYRVSARDLDHCFRFYGNNWGNVGIALEIAHASGRNVRDVCNYYKRYGRYGWNRVLIEIGIRPGSHGYRNFCDRLHHQEGVWIELYNDYERHPRYHKHHRYHRHKYYRDDDDDDDDWDDDDDDDDDD